MRFFLKKKFKTQSMQQIKRENDAKTNFMEIHTNNRFQHT